MTTQRRKTPKSVAESIVQNKAKDVLKKTLAKRQKT